MPDGTEVVLDYKSTGVRVFERPDQTGAPTTATAQRSAFQDQASAWGFPASSVQTIDGVPALVLTQGHGTTINMFLNGLTLTVEGPAAMSSDALVAIANTLS